MSGSQAYDFASKQGGDVGGSLVEEPMVIARLPDIGRDQGDKKSRPSTAATSSAFPRRWPALSKKAIGATGVAVLLVVCWLIFAGSDSDSESWRPPPPAASAPEAPHWNGEAEPKAVIASKVFRPSARSIKLDEVLPRRTTREKLVGKISTPKPVKEMPTRNPATGKQVQKSADVQLPRATSNRPPVIGTPIPPQNMAANNRDWATLSNSEYYWAVRRRSESEACRTASKPNSGRPSGAGVASERPGPARLKGVIETPTVRVY